MRRTPIGFILCASTLMLFICLNTFADVTPGSSDTAIAIAFGLLSTFIGLTGLFIGLLTLRAMTVETGTHHPP
jgi:hypothetical protein